MYYVRGWSDGCYNTMNKPYKHIDILYNWRTRLFIDNAVSPFLGLGGGEGVVCASSGFVEFVGVSCTAIITKNAMMEGPYRLSDMTSHTATIRQ